MKLLIIQTSTANLSNYITKNLSYCPLGSLGFDHASIKIVTSDFPH